MMATKNPKDQGFETAEPETVRDYRYLTRAAKVDTGEWSVNLSAGAELAKLMDDMSEAIYNVDGGPVHLIGIDWTTPCCVLRASGSPLHDVWCDSWTDPCKPDVVHENLAGFPCQERLEALGCPECQTPKVAYCRACALCTNCGAGPRTRREYSVLSLLDTSRKVYGRSPVADAHEAIAKEPNPILKDLLFVEGNLPWHITRTTLPPLTWRTINPVLTYLVVVDTILDPTLEDGEERRLYHKGQILRFQRTEVVENLVEQSFIREICGDVLVDQSDLEHTCTFDPGHFQEDGSFLHQANTISRSWADHDPFRKEMRDRAPRFLTEEEKEILLASPISNKHIDNWLCYAHGTDDDLLGVHGLLTIPQSEECGLKGCTVRRPLPADYCPECGESGEERDPDCDFCGGGC